MRIIVLKDYPDCLGEVIQSTLYSNYTLTGYYGDTGLEWVLECRGRRDTLLLEIALSEYILDAATVNTLEDYCGVHTQRTQKNNDSTV